MLRSSAHRDVTQLSGASSLNLHLLGTIPPPWPLPEAERYCRWLPTNST